MWRRRWRGIPPNIRLVVTVEVAVLSYGGVVHLVQLATGGWPPYRWAPTWLAIYFTSLTLLDPLAASLLWARRTIGLYLGILILVTDAAANGYAVYGLSGATATARISQAIISLLALAAVTTAPRVRPWMQRVSQTRA
ncbi:hypothetical protein AB0880_23300 [Micromonospora chersina]|uniref:hypothetical protein n=1 Tax=Micromonospora chersina TaxID=47854 RepID=UPI0034520C8B